MVSHNLSTSISSDIAPQTFRLFFSGAGRPEANNSTFPDTVARTFDVDLPVSHTLADILDRLPRATTVPVQIQNPFISPDETPDEDRIRSRLATPDTGTEQSEPDCGEFAESLTFGDAPSQFVRADTNRAVVGEWLAAAHAAGHADRFWHQIATDNYTPINPTDGYRPLIRALRDENLATDVFGWVDGTDYGGSVDIYLLFRGQLITTGNDQQALAALGRTPSLNAAQSDTPADSDAQAADSVDVYIGVRSGYDFAGTRAFHSQVFGYTETGLWLYGLGQKHTRRHTGNITRIKSDIKPWWAQQLGVARTFTHDLSDAFVEARSQTFPFAETGLSLVELYSLLGIPSKQSDSYAESAADLVRTIAGPDPDSVSAWTLAFCLLTVLEEDYTSQATDKHLSFTFRGYAETATDLIRKPESMFRRVLEELRLRRAQTDDDADESQLTLSGSSSDSSQEIPLSTRATTVVDQLDAVEQTAQQLLGDYD